MTDADILSLAREYTLWIVVGFVLGRISQVRRGVRRLPIPPERSDHCSVPPPSNND